MSGSTFLGLEAYRLATELADDLRKAVEEWPPFDLWSIGIQLTRAADSIGANIAEGAGRWHRADKRRLFTIARGSLYETEHWIDRAVERGLLTGEYLPRLDEAGRAINGLIKRPSPS